MSFIQGGTRRILQDTKHKTMWGNWLLPARLTVSLEN